MPARRRRLRPSSARSSGLLFFFNLVAQLVLFVAAWIATAEGGPELDDGPLPEVPEATLIVRKDCLDHPVRCAGRGRCRRRLGSGAASALTRLATVAGAGPVRSPVGSASGCARLRLLGAAALAGRSRSALRFRCCVRLRCVLGWRVGSGGRFRAGRWIVRQFVGGSSVGRRRHRRASRHRRRRAACSGAVDAAAAAPRARRSAPRSRPESVAVGVPTGWSRSTSTMLRRRMSTVPVGAPRTGFAARRTRAELAGAPVLGRRLRGDGGRLREGVDELPDRRRCRPAARSPSRAATRPASTAVCGCWVPFIIVTTSRRPFRPAMPT